MLLGALLLAPDPLPLCFLRGEPRNVLTPEALLFGDAVRIEPTDRLAAGATEAALLILEDDVDKAFEEERAGFTLVSGPAGTANRPLPCLIGAAEVAAGAEADVGSSPSVHSFSAFLSLASLSLAMSS